MAVLLTSPDFGSPLLVKCTFLQFEVFPPMRPRSASAPPRLQRAVDTLVRNRKRKPPRRYDDDDAVLREARRHVLGETWQRLGAGIAEKTMGAASQELDNRRMKFRAALTSAGVAELMHTMTNAELQLLVLEHLGVVRNSVDGTRVEIYCSDQQLQEESMADFVDNARTIQIMYANSIFVLLPELETVLAVSYDRRTKISSLKKKARQIVDLPSSKPLRMEYMSGTELVANTVKDAGLVAGDTVRVRWQ